MEQFTDWEDFWKKWHNVPVATEADLYYQVAKTINKEPIKKEIFDLINKNIAEILKLDGNETLVELCCGNGLCTYEFGKICKQVIAVDYSPHLIETAKQHKSAENITYHRANVLDFLEELKKDTSVKPMKYLMNDSLAYFEPKDLEQILRLMLEISGKEFVFLIRGVPNDEIKWNYYNTPERRQFYDDLQAKGDFTNAGMGKWWRPAEIQEVCDQLQLKCKMQNQMPPISNYRMDVLITGKYKRMEQFDNWQQFWDEFLVKRYGKEEVQTEDDLYLQVARTVNRKPIAREAFEEILKQISIDLALSKDDVLVDFCCGNGLFTYELKDKVKQIIGIDFSAPIIDTANKFKKAENITYCLGSVVDYMNSFKESWPGVKPTKYLMNDSLAYFSVADLRGMLEGIKAVSDRFTYLTRGVPNDELKWNYYNTPERRQFYADLQAKGDLTNDGLGSWWKPEDIRAVCAQLGLNCIIRNQELPLSNYRMDIIVSNA